MGWEVLGRHVGELHPMWNQEFLVAWRGADSRGLCPPRQLGSAAAATTFLSSALGSEGRSEGQGQGHVQELSPVHAKGAEGRSVCLLVPGHLTSVTECLPCVRL